MIHPTADVEEGARVGASTFIWHHAHIRSGAVIGDHCTLGHSVYVDSDVHIGDNCKLENRVSVFRGVTIEDGVFVGPHVTFTNDKYPRAIHPDGTVMTNDDWVTVETLVKYGASIGAGAVILPGLMIGRWSMIAAGAVVTRDVPDHGLMVGQPAVLTGYACKCGQALQQREDGWCCPNCHETYILPPLEEAR